METIAFLQQFASPILDQVMLFITNLGSERAYIALLIVCYLAVDAEIGRRVGLYLLFSFYLNFQLKGLFDTPRPYVLEPSVARSLEALETGTGAGFPSGHAQAGATFWFYLALRVYRAWFWLLAIAIVLLISLSRLYLGVHLPLDVLGGLAFGVLLVGLAFGFDLLTADVESPPLWLSLPLGLGLPLAAHLLFPVPEGEMILGGFAAFITAPILVRYDARQALWRRVFVALLGLVLVFAALIGSSLLLPEAVKDMPLVGFIRYLLIAYVGIALTPWLAQRLSLTRKSVLSAE